jgi:hypothetical protein
MRRLLLLVMACTGCSALLGVDQEYVAADGGAGAGADSSQGVESGTGEGATPETGGDDSYETFDSQEQGGGGDTAICLPDGQQCGGNPASCCSGQCTGDPSFQRCCSVQLGNSCSGQAFCCNSSCNALDTCVSQCGRDGDPCHSLGDCCRGYQCVPPQTDGGITPDGSPPSNVCRSSGGGG